MVQRSDLERLAGEHLKDAEALLQAERYDGGVHLCGYAVEVALKASICRALRWTDYPEKGNLYRSFLQHDLDHLLHLSGREKEVREDLLSDWSQVVNWDPSVRYKPPGHASQQRLKQMIESTRAILAKLS